MAPVPEQAPPHAFPSWPLYCLTFYRHLADDYGRCVQALGKVTDPAEAARAEGDCGVRVMNDLMQGWCDLALTPFAAMTKAAASAPEPSGAEPLHETADESTAAKAA